MGLPSEKTRNGRTPVVYDCIVVGAGMSGLAAAHTLQGAGPNFLVLEAGAAAGGRLGGVERTLQDGRTVVFDTACGHFAADSYSFREQLEDWASMALLRRHPPVYAGVGRSERRYTAPLGMHMFAQALARTLPLRRNSAVTRIERFADHYLVHTQGAAEGALHTRSLILTTPPAESLELIDEHNAARPEGRVLFEQMDYERTLTLLLALDQTSPPNTDWNILPPDGPVSRIIDNSAKGVSPQAGALTIHAGPSWSNLFWDGLDSDIIATLTAVAADYVRGTIVHAELLRWDRSTLINPLEIPYLTLSQFPLFVCAGDAFGGGLESAWLSGRSAAQKVLAQMPIA